ncbi:MAG: hypothetical protein NTX48_12585 [Planctomycetales bacterium]|nr:hypothetical protein [Planctomycetales bacterium]
MKELPLTRPSTNGKNAANDAEANTNQIERDRLIDDLAFLVIRQHQYRQRKEKDIDVSSDSTNREET